jgi:hypothetical protein
VVFVLDELSTYTTPWSWSESGRKHEALLKTRRRPFILTFSGNAEEEVTEESVENKTAHLNHKGQLKNIRC